jgi:NifU-like protein involved in Fe-S cluster formation
MSAEKLYTPQMLGAAVELAGWPALENAPYHGAVRAPTCGSTLAMDLTLDNAGHIEQIGLRVRACAVGQAAAAVFARHAGGFDQAQLHAMHDRLAAWLGEEAPAPDWPDLELIAPARDYRARHGAMLLPWKAALDALSSAPASG